MTPEEKLKKYQDDLENLRKHLKDNGYIHFFRDIDERVSLMNLEDDVWHIVLNPQLLHLRVFISSDNIDSILFRWDRNQELATVYTTFPPTTVFTVTYITALIACDKYAFLVVDTTKNTGIDPKKERNAVLYYIEYTTGKRVCETLHFDNRTFSIDATLDVTKVANKNENHFLISYVDARKKLFSNYYLSENGSGGKTIEYMSRNRQMKDNSLQVYETHPGIPFYGVLICLYEFSGRIKVDFYTFNTTTTWSLFASEEIILSHYHIRQPDPTATQIWMEHGRIHCAFQDSKGTIFPIMKKMPDFDTSVQRK